MPIIGGRLCHEPGCFEPMTTVHEGLPWCEVHYIARYGTRAQVVALKNQTGRFYDLEFALWLQANFDDLVERQRAMSERDREAAKKAGAM